MPLECWLKAQVWGGEVLQFRKYVEIQFGKKYMLFFGFASVDLFHQSIHNFVTLMLCTTWQLLHVCLFFHWFLPFSMWFVQWIFLSIMVENAVQIVKQLQLFFYDLGYLVALAHIGFDWLIDRMSLPLGCARAVVHRIHQLWSLLCLHSEQREWKAFRFLRQISWLWCCCQETWRTVVNGNYEHYQAVETHTHRDVLTGDGHILIHRWVKSSHNRQATTCAAVVSKAKWLTSCWMLLDLNHLFCARFVWLTLSFDPCLSL